MKQPIPLKKLKNSSKMHITEQLTIYLPATLELLSPAQRSIVLRVLDVKFLQIKFISDAEWLRMVK